MNQAMIADPPAVAVPAPHIPEAPSREAFRAVVEEVKAQAKITAALEGLAVIVDAYVAAVRFAAADALRSGLRLQASGFPFDASSLVERLEDDQTKLREMQRETDDAFRPFLRSRSMDHFARRSTDRVRTLLTRALSELAQGINSLGKLRRSDADNPYDGPAVRSLEAYRDAFERVLPGAELRADRVEAVGVGFDVEPTVRVRLPTSLEGRARARLEQDVHQLVEAHDPSLVGVFAFRYVAA